MAAPTLAIEAAGVISSADQGEAAERLAAIAEKGVTLFASSTRATLPGAPEIMARFGAEQLPKLHALKLRCRLDRHRVACQECGQSFSGAARVLVFQSVCRIREDERLGLRDPFLKEIVALREQWSRKGSEHCE